MVVCSPTVPTSVVTRLSKRWCRASSALDGGLRVGYLASEIESHPVELAAEALDELCSAAEQAEPEARQFLVTLVDLLTSARGAPLATLLRDEALHRSRLALSRLLRRPAASSTTSPIAEPQEARVPDYGTGRALTLGERKGLAARRPGDPAVLTEVAASPRWAHRVKVRLAIVLNPDTPAALAIPLLALLVRPELKLVAEATGLAPTLRAAAHDLLQRRPPVRTPPKSGIQ